MTPDFPTAPLAPGHKGAGGGTVEKSLSTSHTEILTLPSPAIFVSYPALTRGVSGRTQLTGQLQENYLFALVAEHVATPSQESRDWLKTMRVWTLVIALRLERNGSVRDGHLRQVAKGIRLACDREPQWVKLLAALNGPVRDIDELTSFLAYRAYQLRHHSQEELGGEQRKFLRSLIELAEGRSSPEEVPAHTASIISKLQLPKPAHSIFGQIDLPDENPEGETGESSSVWALGESSPGLLAVERVKPADSYLQQQSSAKSIHLLDAEGLHYLPWSWGKPNHNESIALNKWIAALLEAPNQDMRMLGAYVWIATRTGRSMYQTLRIAISTALDAEWSISPDFQDLKRLPPRRSSGWLPESHDESAWVTEVAESNRIKIAKEVQAILQKTAGCVATFDALGDLWAGVDAPASLFLKERPKALCRVTPGMLGQALPQRVFDDTGDGSFARVVASTPRTGLPGACAYANWSQFSVDRQLNVEVLAAVQEGTTHRIGAGSRLDPLENMLIDSIRQAGEQLRARMGAGDLFSFHNGYVSYLTVSLLAATGARPIRDPFESFSHFDLDAGFVFINDKASGAARNGRLVPLPASVIRQVRSYQKYLLKLSKELASQHQGLATDIGETAIGSATAPMPFLFMFEEMNRELGWASVNSAAIEASELFHWPLPLNLFRHRLAQRLRSRNVDPEIIDGILGHAEFGCITYGDDSTRTWASDMAALRPHLEAAYAALGFTALSPVPVMSDIARFLPSSANDIRAYGMAARAIEREQTVLVARDQAERIIDGYLNGKTLTELDQDGLWLLSKQLLLSVTGMPLSSGYVRYGVLMEKLEAAWKEEGRRVQLNRRFARLKPPSTLFSEQAPGVAAWHATAVNAVTDLADSGYERLSVKEKRIVATVLLCLEARVTHPEVLCDVACGLNYRVTLLEDRFDLEHGEDLDIDDPDATMERYPILARLAALLGCLRLSKQATTQDISQAKKVLSQIPRGALSCLQGLIPEGGQKACKPDWKQFLITLSARIDQLNAITLPGALAAWYAGRLSAASLGWRDRIRMTLGQAPIFDAEQDGDAVSDSGQNQPSQPVEKASVAIRSPDENLDSEAMQQAGRAFFAQLRQELQGGKKGIESQLSTQRRRDLAADIRKLVRSSNGKVSQAILMLGQWIAALVGGEARGHKTLKQTAISRYLSALSPMFEGHAYTVDLIAMDGEDVTALYADMLGSIEHKNSRCAADRLADFHRWASGLGVEDPDWTEMPVTVMSSRRAPGLISEPEYQLALDMMARDARVPEEQRVASCFLLLCCYRFGLRGGECLGLRRDDWISDDDEQIVVLVQNHPWRTLKSKASRRQVPLLFRLSDHETHIIKKMINGYESRHGSASDFPLFGDDAQYKTLPRLSHIKGYVNHLLKQITGNPEISLHHARHTAANRIAAVMLRVDMHTWNSVAQCKGRNCDHPRLEGILLGRAGVSRRQSWGLARYLGHAGTRTLWHSYLHLQPDWARLCLRPALGSATAHCPAGVADLNGIRLAAEVDGVLLRTTAVPEAPLNVENALRLLRLLSRGKSIEDAASSLALNEIVARQLGQAAKKIGTRLRLYQKNALKNKDGEDDYEFLRRYPNQTWTRMINWASGLGDGGKSTVDSVPTQLLAMLVEVVGATCQVVMWQREHFSNVRMMLNIAGITDHEFRIYRTKRWHPELEEMAREHGFDVLDPASYLGRVQVDSVSSISPSLDVARRAGLFFNERSTGVVRNRLELLLVLLAVAGART